MSMKTIRRYVAGLVAAVVMVLGAGQPAQADPNAVLNKIRASGALRFPVMVGEEPGYVRDRATGEWGGHYVEWAKSIAGVLGVKLVMTESTWGNLAADFQADRLDLAIALNPNPTRGLVVDYTPVPLFHGAWAIVAKPGFGRSTWSELNDPSVRIVVQSGSTMQVVAGAMTPNAQVTPIDTRPNGVLQIQSGRADAMIIAIIDGVRIAKETNLKVAMPTPMLGNPAFIGIRRQPGNEGFLNFLTNWTNQQRALGLAQGKLINAYKAQGLDLSILPSDFSF